MYPYKRIMVGLDFTPMDKTLIEYTSFLAKLLKPEKVYFVNAQEGLEDPDELLAEYPELGQPIDEKLRQELQKEVEESFAAHAGIDTECLVLEGSPAEELHDYVQIKQIDLLIVGRKRDLDGKGVLPQNLARKVPASILFVPENRQPSLRKILVPVDFSPNSKMALEEAVDLAEHDKGQNTIITLHAYKLPSGYYKTGKSEEEFAAIMHDNAQKKHRKFMDTVTLKDGMEIVPVFLFDSEKATSGVVYKYANENKVDLIVIGGRGRTNAAAFLLGSTTEKLITLDTDIPVLVVKDKKATFGFLEALKRL